MLSVSGFVYIWCHVSPSCARGCALSNVFSIRRPADHPGSHLKEQPHGRHLYLVDDDSDKRDLVMAAAPTTMSASAASYRIPITRSLDEDRVSLASTSTTSAPAPPTAIKVRRSRPSSIHPALSASASLSRARLADHLPLIEPAVER